MKNLLLGSTAVFFALAGSASAEQTYGNLFWKSHRIDAGAGGKETIKVFGGAFESKLGKLSFSGELALYDIGIVDLTLGSAGVGYKFASGLTLGADAAFLDIDAGGLGSLDTKVVSIYADYRVSNFTFGASIGDASDIDDNIYSLYGTYDVSPNGRVGLEFWRLDGETVTAAYADFEMQRLDIRADFLTTDGLDLFGIGGAYDFGNKFSVIASAATADLGIADATAFSVGGRYEFLPGVNAELSVGRLNISGAGDANVLSAGVTFEMGRRAASRRTIATALNQSFSNIANLNGF